MANEKPKNQYAAFGGDLQSFVNQYDQFKQDNVIVKEHITTAMIQVSEQDYAAVAKMMEGDPKLLASIPKMQTTIVITAFIEFIPKVKKETPKIIVD